MGLSGRQVTVLIKGAGEIGSGVAHRLAGCGYLVCLTETAKPLAVCRGTTFSEAVFDGFKEVEGVAAELTPPWSEGIYRVWARGNIAVVVDPEGRLIEEMRPDVVVDAIMAKKNTGTRITDAPLVIGLGPGFAAGRDVHAIVETANSPSLGKVITAGTPEANNGEPVSIGGLGRERVAWAPCTGVFTTNLGIGDTVARGQAVGAVDGEDVLAPVGGILRGLLRSGVRVEKGAKLVEVDPVNDRAICHTIRDKMRVVADGVLRAITASLEQAAC